MTVRTFNPVMAPRQHQRDFAAKIETKRFFALFAEMGLGKTKSAIDFAGRLWAAGKIDRCLVVALKGVHEQWIEDQLPLHLDPLATCTASVWRNGKVKQVLAQGHSERFHWLAINFDALKTKDGFDAADKFIGSQRCLLIVDESHEIKNATTKRWKALFRIRQSCAYALLLSGTPIAKNIVDLWAQYKMLDEDIIGCRWLTNFRARYCIMGGYEMREVVGTRNLDDLRFRTDPYTYRITKKEATDLPPKTYREVHFEMSDEQRKHHKTMKEAFLADLGNGVYLNAAHAAVALTRLQQITCGFLPDPSSSSLVHLENNRLIALERTIASVSGKVVIWCRFNADIAILKRHFKEAAVTYYGGDSGSVREKSKQAFIDPDSEVRFMISNPAAGGTGIDGYQRVCSVAIYYSNSFNAIHRWQSEDRIHRDGMKENAPATYIDLICRGSIDKRLLANLRGKKSISDLMLDDVRKMLTGDA